MNLVWSPWTGRYCSEGRILVQDIYGPRILGGRISAAWAALGGFLLLLS